MKDAEADYAAVDGVTAWEGKVGLNGEHGPEGSRWIVRRENDEGWDVVWQGEVPIGLFSACEVRIVLIHASLCADVDPKSAARSNRFHDIP